MSSARHIDSLTGKTILILSQQPWGKMFVSKHHYALELAKRGNKVFFLNPPHSGSTKDAVSISAIEQHDQLFLIDHNLWFPYRLKFHAMPLFHLLMQSHISKIRKAIGPIDIVWSFDLGYLYPFKAWKAKYNIFHPVDEPLTPQAIEAAKGADIIFSVTREILDKYKAYDIDRHFINHGVSNDFLAPVDVYKTTGNPPRVGIAGNLLRGDLDRETMLQVMRENPDVQFHCWGSYSAAQANMGGRQTEASDKFVGGLKQLPNVILHGPVPAKELAKAVHDMDAFLICYDVQKDQSRGTNYHKVMEFLSTGKVVVSNNITTYKDKPRQVRMVASREHNKELPALFKETIANLALYNSPEWQQERLDFARENAYARQVQKIESLISGR